MTDFFALLDEPRRPWLDPESLKVKFLARSSQVHPDRVHGVADAERTAASDQYAELNAAYNCLRVPKERLRHLLELELGEKPAGIQGVPEEMMAWQFEVGKVCRDADAFLVENTKVTSPVLKVQWFEAGQEWTGKLQTLQQKINSRQDELMIELEAMNPTWESQDGQTALPLKRLDEIYRVLGYLARWSAQIQERVVRLSF